MESATAILREEHQWILRVVEALQRTLEATLGGGDLDLHAIGDCVSFFRLFADACHHGKEEDLLFPELVASGLPGDSGPIAVMLAEHRRGRAFVQAMKEALDQLRAGDAEAEHRLLQAAFGYIELIRGHIAKEDNILFEIADMRVHGEECASLCARYRDVDGCPFEDRTKAELEALAERIVEHAG